MSEDTLPGADVRGTRCRRCGVLPKFLPFHGRIENLQMSLFPEKHGKTIRFLSGNHVTFQFCYCGDAAQQRKDRLVLVIPKCQVTTFATGSLCLQTGTSLSKGFNR